MQALRSGSIFFYKETRFPDTFWKRKGSYDMSMDEKNLKKLAEEQSAQIEIEAGSDRTFTGIKRKEKEEGILSESGSSRGLRGAGDRAGRGRRGRRVWKQRVCD